MGGITVVRFDGDGERGRDVVGLGIDRCEQRGHGRGPRHRYPNRRPDEHRKRSTWGHLLDTCEVEGPYAYYEALAVERKAIEAEAPRFNRMYLLASTA